MKYKSFYFKFLTFFLKKPMIRKFGEKSTKESLKKAKPVYREMIEKTEDIGKDNPMAGNIYMGYVFMAICRAGNFKPDDFIDATADFMNGKIIKRLTSGLDLNKTEDLKKFSCLIHKRQEWVDSHSEYKNKTWDFNFDETLHKDGFYYYFTRCPMNTFARENGYLDVLPVACNTDYLSCAARKAVLHREQTLASGGDICDYWIVGDQDKNPK